MSVSDKSLWNQWAQILQQYNLVNPILFILESAAPIKILLAQSIFLTSPFLRNSTWDQLPTILEDPQETNEFIKFLKSKEWHE